MSASQPARKRSGAGAGAEKPALAAAGAALVSSAARSGLAPPRALEERVVRIRPPAGPAVSLAAAALPSLGGQAQQRERAGSSGFASLGTVAQLRRDIEREGLLDDTDDLLRAANEATALAALPDAVARRAAALALLPDEKVGPSSPRGVGRSPRRPAGGGATMSPRTRRKASAAAETRKRAAAAVSIQSVVRRFLAVHAAFRARCERAASVGVMAALPGFTQGQTGWYAAGDNVLFIAVDTLPDGSSDYRSLVGPLAMETFRALRRDSRHVRSGRVQLACPGTEQGKSGLYMDLRLNVSRWEVDFNGAWSAEAL